MVTGASRGVGKGIAHELGIAGATVFITGRSRRNHPTTDNLPGSIDETAELVTEAGGEGILIECDHTDDEDVQQMAKEIKNRHDRLDLLINNVWGGYEQYDAEVWQLSPWEQPVWRWDKMMETGVRAHYTTTRAVLPLILESNRPLILNISYGEDGNFLGDVQYDVAKYAVTRLGFALSEKLKSENVTALTIYPGFTRTERVEEGASKKELKKTKSPRFTGRGVVALAGDENVSDRSGGAYSIEELSQEYGFSEPEDD